MILHASFTDGGYTVSDGQHTLFGLSLAEYRFFRAEFDEGSRNPAELFRVAAARHAEAVGRGR